MITTIATSQYSARIFEKTGFDEVSRDVLGSIQNISQVRSVKYTDYLVDGEMVFPPKEPHTQARLFVKAATSGSSLV